MLSRVDARQHVLATILNPLDRSTEVHRNEPCDHVLWKQARLDTETATDIWSHDTNPVLRKSQTVGETSSQKMWNLGRVPHREAARARVIIGNQTPRLKWLAGLPMRGQLDGEAAVGLLKRSLDVSSVELAFNVEVVRPAVVQDGGVSPDRLIN